MKSSKIHGLKGRKRPTEVVLKIKNALKKQWADGTRKGRKQTKESIEKIRQSKLGKPSKTRGEKSNLWKGGVTPINQTIRMSLEYKLWRESVFKRDNYTCVWCGAKSGNGKAVILQADHIKPFYLYPELRFAIDNGRTLCKSCHKKTDTWGRPIKRNNKK